MVDDEAMGLRQLRLVMLRSRIQRSKGHGINAPADCEA